MGIAHLIPIIFSVLFEPVQIGPYLFGGVISCLIGAAFYLIGERKRDGDDLREAILFVCAFWIFAPMLAAPSFMFSGLGFLPSIFESASALTTTGAWLSETAARASMSGIIWRSTLQWIGGFATLVFAASVLIRPIFVGIEIVPPSFARREDASYFGAMESTLVFLLFPYIALTLAAASLFIISGQNVPFAFATGMSLVASGGFVADPSAISDGSPAFFGAAIPIVIISGANFVVIAAAADSLRTRKADVETLAYLSIIMVLASVLFYSVWSGGANATSDGLLSGLLSSVFDAASLVSTNGVTVGQPDNLPIVLVAVLIGGSAVSTAGGLKVIRWFVLFRRVSQEVNQLSQPNAVFGASFVQEELGVWMHFIGFTFVLGCLTVVGLATSNSFEVSAVTAVAALANAGPILHLVQVDADGYGSLSTLHLVCLTLAMVLGRVEALAALALLNSNFWRS
ncbi:MAG: potassium transporter TrkG [Pseudomonadota bacterium]